MQRTIVSMIGFTLLALVPGPVAADTCDAYGKASRGYADMLLEKEKHPYKGRIWCATYRKAQAFAKQAAKTARGCKNAQSAESWGYRYPPKDAITCD